MSRPAFARRSLRRRWRAILRRFVARLVREAIEENTAGLRGAITRSVEGWR